jgi:hypothetical protein
MSTSGLAVRIVSIYRVTHLTDDTINDETTVSLKVKR